MVAVTHCWFAGWMIQDLNRRRRVSSLIVARKADLRVKSGRESATTAPATLFVMPNQFALSQDVSCIAFQGGFGRDTEPQIRVECIQLVD